jgi:hypothetical protein
MKRLIVAALCGTFVSAVLLTATLLLADERALGIIQALHGVTNAAQTFGFVLGFLVVFGALPAVPIGIVLKLVRRASPVTLVLTPAILFALTLIEIAREMGEAQLVAEGLPAIVLGGAVMFWILVSWQVPRPVEIVFE